MDWRQVIENSPSEHWRRGLQAAGLHAAAGGFPRPGGSGTTEDGLSCWVRGDELLVAVADGVGGMPEGGHAARLALDRLAAALAVGGGTREAVLDGFERTNRALLAHGSATTLTVLWWESGSLRSFHCGDSSALVVGQRGALRLLLLSHGPVGYAVEAGMLDEEEALHHDERHLISNHLGAEDMRVELGSPIPLRRYDTVVLASDGLWDNLTLEEVMQTARRGPIEDCAATLLDRAAARMAADGREQPSKPDDLSLLLLRRTR